MSDYEDISEVSEDSEESEVFEDDFEADEPSTPPPEKNAPAEAVAAPAPPEAPADDVEVLDAMVKVEDGMSDVTVQHFAKFIARFTSFSAENGDVAPAELEFLAGELETAWGGSHAAIALSALLRGHPDSTGKQRTSTGRCFKGKMVDS